MGLQSAELGEAPATHLTLRSLLLGCVVCGWFGLAGPYWCFYLMSSSMFSDYHTAGATFALLMLALVFNAGLVFLWRRFRLSGGELRFITAMTLTSGSIVTSGLIAYLIPGMTSPYYHSNAANQLEARVWPLLDQLRMQHWLFPLDPGRGQDSDQKLLDWAAAGRADTVGPLDAAAYLVGRVRYGHLRGDGRHHDHHAQAVDRLRAPELSHRAGAGGALLGGGTLGGRQATVVGSQIWHADMRNGPMSGAAHGMYLVERRRRGLFWALLLALAITYAVAGACTVWISYRHAALNMDHWFFINSPNGPWRWATNLINQGHEFSFRGLLWTGVGAGVMAALVAAQRAFFWWPIHPVAFLIWNTHMVYNFWVSIFLAWGAKVAVVNLGGYEAYRKGRRFCIGMVLGYFIAGGLWGIIDTITGAVGDSVFYI